MHRVGFRGRLLCFILRSKYGSKNTDNNIGFNYNFFGGVHRIQNCASGEITASSSGCTSGADGRGEDADFDRHDYSLRYYSGTERRRNEKNHRIDHSPRPEKSKS